MQWHYVKDGQSLGPVDEAGVAGLEKKGEIGPETWMWCEGMGSWALLSSLRDRLPAPVAAAPDAAALGALEAPARAAEPASAALDVPAAGPVEALAAAGAEACAECGKVFRGDELFHYKGKAICPLCKPAFLQRIKQGSPMTGDLVTVGFWHRFAARFIDGLLLQVVNKVVQLPFDVGDKANPFSAIGLLSGMVVASLAVSACYEIFTTSKMGGTIGKLAVGLRVVDMEGHQLDIRQATYRYLGTILSGLTCGIGYLIMISHPLHQTLHDRLVGTLVVKK